MEILNDFEKFCIIFVNIKTLRLKNMLSPKCIPYLSHLKLVREIMIRVNLFKLNDFEKLAKISNNLKYLKCLRLIREPNAEIRKEKIEKMFQKIETFRIIETYY